MFDFIRIFFTGLIISLLGSLPLGSLNITAMQLSVQESTRNAVKFGLGVALIEILYVRVSLYGIDWVIENDTIFRVLEWCTVFLFLMLAVSSFMTFRRQEQAQKNIILRSRVSRFMLGLTMSALNPVQIPFWFIWSTYLMSTKMLRPTAVDYNVYTVGIGIGTLFGLAIFIFAGRWVVNKLKASHSIINLIVGVIFFISAIIQLYRVLYKPMNQQFKSAPAAQIFKEESQDNVTGFLL